MLAKTTKSCRHIRPSGRRCQASALRNRAFCYYHESINAHLRTLHPPEDGTHNFISPMVIDPDRFQREPILADYFAKTRGPLELNFPVLEDSDAVQLALSMVLTALGQNRLELKRATTILYTLQIASTNATRESPDSVEDFTTDDTGQVLAPDEESQSSKPAPASWHALKSTATEIREHPPEPLPHASEGTNDLCIESPTATSA